MAGVGGGDLLDGIEDGGSGGAGDHCAGITAGVMALMLASWQMRFSVGISICGCCDDVGVNVVYTCSVRKILFSDTHSGVPS